MEKISDIRPSPIAGTWYLGNPEKLAEQVDSFLGSAKLSKDDVSGNVIGLLVPHAGHRYSGQTAAYAFKTIQGKPRKLVVMLSPYHSYQSAEFLTTSHNAFQTPLGIVPVAVFEIQKLAENLEPHHLRLVEVSRDQEHSIEIQLPFLQRAWKTDFTLLPLMIRSHNPETLKLFASVLYDVIENQDFLLIASSDLSHFFPLTTAEMLDAEMLRRVKSFDPMGVLAAEADGSGSACGAGAVAALLFTSNLTGADTVQILNYSTSADSTGDASSVVGYGSAVVLARSKA